MLEQPIPLRSVFTSRENLFQLGLRCRHNFRSQRNPNNKLAISKMQFETYFKFTIVRNPWARAYSWYKNCMRDANHRSRYGLDQDTSLSDFLRRNIGRGALRSQVSWIEDYSGGIPMDFIGRFESLASDFHEICEKLNLPQIDLPHELKGGGEDFRDQFDDECVRLIGETYSNEIELFNYSFDE